MIFPYLDVHRRGIVRALPIIPVRLLGPAREIDVVALVDSGAEHSVFSAQLIPHLDLTTKDAAAVQIFGVGGQESRGYLMDIEHQLGRHRWIGPAIFSDAIDSPMILGQAGFFAFFTVTFKRRQLLMDIRRSR